MRCILTDLRQSWTDVNFGRRPSGPRESSRPPPIVPIDPNHDRHTSFDIDKPPKLRFGFTVKNLSLVYSILRLQRIYRSLHVLRHSWLLGFSSPSSWVSLQLLSQTSLHLFYPPRQTPTKTLPDDSPLCRCTWLPFADSSRRTRSAFAQASGDTGRSGGEETSLTA